MDDEYAKLIARLSLDPASSINSENEEAGNNRSMNYKKFASHDYRSSAAAAAGVPPLRKHKSYSNLDDLRGVVQPSFHISSTQYYSHHESRHYSHRSGRNLAATRKNASESTSLLPKQHLKWYDTEGPIYCYFVLFWCCLCYASGYYIYDSIGVVQGNMQEYYGITSGQFGLLYSVYSLPNCIIPFFGGFLLDKLGLRSGLFLCCVCVCLGPLLVAFSSVTQTFALALAGRFVFGLGAETSYVALDTIIVNWFANKAVALAMGICVSAGRLGTWLTFNLNPLAINLFHNWKAAVWVAAAFGALGFLSACIFIVLDKFAERKKKLKNVTPINDEGPPPEPIKLGVVRTFPVTFWVICLLVTMYYAVVFPFESTATKLLSERYGYDESNAGRIISLLPLVSMILSPPFGYLVDKIGYRPLLVLMGEILMVSAILCMALTTFNPIPSVVVVGIVFSLVPAALWPCIPVVVTGQFATAFGLMTSIMNLGLLLTYYLQGLVNDIFNNNTQYALFFYSGLGGLGLLLAALWVIMDIKNGGQCSKKNAPPMGH